jgi:hypothetical protein
MIILWVRKAKKDKEQRNPKEEKQSFQEHDEVMKKFRQAHPEFNIITDKDILTGEGNLLAPVQKVKLTEHIQN